MRFERKRAAWRRVLLLTLALAFCAPFVFARAGGGGGYSGGGGHSSGGGGHYSGGGSHYSGGPEGDLIGDLISLYIRFVVRRPLIGIPFTVVLIVAGMGLYHDRDVLFVGAGAMEDAISRGAEMQDRLVLAQRLSQVRARDPDFDPAAFLARAGPAFLKIQEAWSRQDMAPARAFISDGVMERFSIYIEMQKADKLRNDMKDVKVLSAELAEVETDPHFDTLHVAVTASAIDTDVSLEDGRLLRGSGEAEPFVEVWSFLRRPGAKSLKKPGLIEGCCPNCGSALSIADAAKCETCQSWVNSGEYDWVLSEITQECEWSVRGAGEAVPGFARLAQADPALNTQSLEDRASVAFWRWQLAFSEGSAGPMRSVASEDFCRTLEAELKGRPSYNRGVAVGSVEVLALEPGEPFDRAHVMVKWSGELFERADGEPVSKGQAARRHVLVLGRRHGAATDPRSGLRSSRCAACGAPAPSRDAYKCGYCGELLNDGKKGWVVLEAVPAGLWKRPPEAGGATPAPDADWAESIAPSEALAVMVSAMAADGELDPKETAYLRAYAERRAIPPDTLAGLLESARGGRLEIPQPQDSREAEACLRGLIRMSLTDGRVADKESKLIAAYGRRVALSESQVWMLIKEERDSLYRAAKRTLKDQAA